MTHLDEQALAAKAWADLESAASATGALEVANVTLPIEKARALVAERVSAVPSSPVSELVGRDAAGETVFGLRVAAYRETHPEHGDRYGHAYSEHWSTPNYNHPNVKVERLFTEDQLRDTLTTLTTLSVRNAELERGIDRLAAYIMENVPGEPSENQGAVDTAIRLLGKNAELEREVKRLREALSGCFCPRPVNAREYGFTVGECVAAGECGCCDGETLRSLSTSPQGGEHE